MATPSNSLLNGIGYWPFKPGNAGSSPVCSTSFLVAQDKYFMATKQCSVCKIEKDYDDFWMRSQGGKRYPFHSCKQCANAARNIRRKDYREPPTAEAVSRQAARVKLERLNNTNRATYLYQDSRRSDRKKNLDNDLDREFIERALEKPCHYCGAEEGQMTVDRVDNSIGHLKSNVVTACYRCNIVRGSMPFEAWAVIAPAMKEAYNKGLFGDWRSEPVSRKKV